MGVRWNYSCAVSWDAKGMVKHFDGYHSICRDMICLNVSSIFIRLSSWFRPHLCVLVSCFFFCLIAEEIFVLDKLGIISVKDKHSFSFLLSSFSLSTNGCVVFYIKQKQRDFLQLIIRRLLANCWAYSFCWLCTLTKGNLPWSTGRGLSIDQVKHR